MEFDDTMNSEFEVINESSREGSPDPQTIRERSFSQSYSTDFSQEISDRLGMLASFHLGNSLSSSSPLTSSPIKDTLEPQPSTSANNDNYMRMEESSINYTKSLNDSLCSNTSMSSLLNYQQETKQMLQKALEQMENYNYEKKTMSQKIEDLENKVDRLVTKNSKLQKAAPRSLVSRNSLRPTVTKKSVEIQTEAVPSGGYGSSIGWTFAILFFAISIGLASMLNEESKNARELFAKVKSAELQLGKTEEFAEKTILQGCLTDIIEINPEYSEEEALNMLRRSTTGYIPDIASCHRMRDLLAMKQQMETILREQLHQYRCYVHTSAGVCSIFIFMLIFKCIFWRTPNPQQIN